jgi:hypothetical protein
LLAAWGCVAAVTPDKGAPRPAEPPVADSASEEAVLAHPFWKRRLTRRELGRILDWATQRGASLRLAVDDRGEVWTGFSSVPSAPGRDARRYVLLLLPLIGTDRRKALAELHQQMTALVEWEKGKASQGGAEG